MRLDFMLHALRHMLRYRTQTALAVLGVAIGAANIILLISITDLGRRQSLGLISDFGANMLIVTPYIPKDVGGSQGLTPIYAASHMDSAVATVIAGLPEIESAAGFLLLPGHASYGGHTMFTTVAGVQPAFSALVDHPPRRGRWLTDADERAGAAVTCLGDSVRRELFGDADPLGQPVDIKGETFTVVGVMGRKGRVGLEDFDSRVFIPLSTAQRLYEYDGIHAVFSHYRLKVGERVAIAAVKQALAKLVPAGEKLDDTYTVFTIKEARKLMDDTLGIFRAVLAGIASIAMFVAGIGIMNVMLIRVLQRRKEIGVRRAVGATPRLIAQQFLLEAVAQALAGALVGVVLGMLGVHIYCRYAQWDFYVSPLTLLLAVAFSITVGLVFGAYPALRAGRMDPIQGLRQDI